MGFFKSLDRSVRKLYKEPTHLQTMGAGLGPARWYKLVQWSRKRGPDAEAVPDTPMSGDAEGEAERRRQLRARGRASTILTSGEGLTDPASTASRQLLGSA